jgi:hypothetical protein
MYWLSQDGHMKVFWIHRQCSSYGRGTVRRGYFDDSKIGVSARTALLDSPRYTEREALTQDQQDLDTFFK